MATPREITIDGTVFVRKDSAAPPVNTENKAAPSYLVVDPSQLPLLSTIEQAAAILNKAPKTLRNWYYEGKGPRPVLKIGGSLRYPRNALAAFLESAVCGRREPG